MRFFAYGRKDGCFAAPAASRCCACGRGAGFAAVAGGGFRRPSGEQLSFIVERKLPKKAA